MVSRKSLTPMMTRRRASAGERKQAARPKRNVSPKNLDDSVSGLSWREESELNKALYASLLESRRSSRDSQYDDDLSEMDHLSTVDNGSCKAGYRRTSTKDIRYMDESSCSQDSMRSFTGKETPKASDNKQQKFYAQRKFAVNSFAALHTKVAAGSNMSKGGFQRISGAGCQKKLHAQRKFASGSTSSTPSDTPSKQRLKASPMKLFPTRPTTEDFLTYLCFRGTSILPPHLDLLNTHREELSECPTPVAGRAGFTRDSSPASSSSMSHQNEDSIDIPDLAPRSMTPSRKAARASASTPETARGFAALRQISGRSSSQPSSPLSRGQQSSLLARRTRLSDSYSPAAKYTKALYKPSPKKSSMTDRLSLKRKAMATLTASSKLPSNGMSENRHVRNSWSDSRLLSNKKARRELLPKDKHGGSSSPPESSRKRKSTKDLSILDFESEFSRTSPKRCKLRSSKRVKKLLKLRSKSNSSKPSSDIYRKPYFDYLETHPVKRLATNIHVAVRSTRAKKRRGPMTRASAHLKAALATAKRAASRKLRLVTSTVSSSSSSDGTPAVTATTMESCRPRSPIKQSPPSKNGDICSPKYEKVKPKPAGEQGKMVDCLTFHPTEDQFRDPMVYIQSIRPQAEQYGMCRVVPPQNWKMESRFIEDMRFTSHIQHVHRMRHRWGKAAQRMECIKQHFESTGSEKFVLPQLGGVELDLVRLYNVVQKFGGLRRITDKKKWLKVAESLKLPKLAQDRVTKLYTIYCKYLLTYESLTEEEKRRLEQSVRARADKQGTVADRHTCDPCITKGRSQPLCGFTRAARNIQAMYGDSDTATPEAVERAYWEVVEQGAEHLSVQGARLDTSVHGSMFPVRKDNSYSRHPWNLHNFLQNSGSVLKHLGLIAGVTVPTLHLGMLYTSSPLSCNGHNLPYVQYLHHGSDIVWYAVPEKNTDQLRSALNVLAPSFVRGEGFMLESDTLMMPPSSLIEQGVSVSRCVQSSRQFVVVFPEVYTSNISCGYTLSESVHYGPPEWIKSGYQAAEALGVNNDTELFSMDALLVFLARDHTTSDASLALILPHLEMVVARELRERKQLSEVGLKTGERLFAHVEKLCHTTDIVDEINICDISGKICYLSMVLNEQENSAFSLDQGLHHLEKRKNLKHCKLMYRYSESELTSLLQDVKDKVNTSPGSKRTRKLDIKSEISPQLSRVK